MKKQSPASKSVSGNRFVAPGIVFVIALIVRIIFLNGYSALPTFGYLTFDGLHFSSVAMAIAQGQALGYAAVYKAPLYSLFLAGIYAYVSSTLFQALVIQCIVGSLSAVLICQIGRRFYSEKIALTAGIFAALYGPLVFFDTEVLPVSLTIFLILTTIYLLLRYEESRKLVLLIGSGVTVALAGAATPETLVLLPIAAWWIYRSDAPKNVSSGKHSLVFLVVAIVLTTPFAIRSHVLGGESIPYLSDVGVRLAIANQTGSESFSPTLPNSPHELGQSYANALEATLRTHARELSFDEVGSFWLKHAINEIVSHPIDWIKLEFHKLAYLIDGGEISTDRPIYYLGGKTFPLNLLLWSSLISIPFGLILPLAAVTAFVRSTSQRKQTLLVASAIALGAAALLFNVYAFQRLLIVPFVIIWAAGGLWALIALYRKQDFRGFYRALAVLVVALILVNSVTLIPGLLPKSDPNYEGQMFLANALAAKNRTDDALEAYQQAVRIEPRSPRAYGQIAGIYARSGRDSLATLYYTRAAGLDPNDDRPLRGIAAMLRKGQKVGELNQFLVNTMREFPKANWAYEDYAQLYIRIQEYTQAADIYERSFQADTTDFESIFKKGEVYLQADMRGEAEAEFKRYLSYIPSSVPARANLGQIYARQQRVQDALREFEYVKSMEPTNPAAHFNLASLYMQMGDFAQAGSHLDSAAALDNSFPGLDRLKAMLDSARTAHR